MPDLQATATDTAADAAVTNTTNADGATPPPAPEKAAPQKGKMTAKEALDGLNRLEFKQKPEWVLDEPESDILTELEQSDDPLAGLYDETNPDEVEQQEEPTAEAEATPETPEEAPVKTEADGRKRVNIFRRKDGKDSEFIQSELSRRALLLADEEGIDVLDAFKALGVGRELESKTAEAVVAKPEPTVAEIDAQLTDLKAKREDAKAKFDDDGRAQITEQIQELLQSRQDAKDRDALSREAQRNAQSTVAQQVNESIGRASNAYPDSIKEGSKLNLAIAAEVARLETLNSGTLKEADWPETVAAKIATRLGIAPVLSKAPVKAPVTAPKPGVPVKRATALPAPGSVTSPPAPVSKHAELRQKMQAARAAGNLQALQKLGDEIMALSAA